MATFREATRKRLLDAIRSVQPSKGGRWKVLVLDAEATRIISSSCRMFDIMEEGITVVENLHLARQPFPNFDAIYILTPTPESVQSVINDFEQPKSQKQYAAIHLFFTSRIADATLQRLSNSAAASSIETLKELNLEYLSSEGPEGEVFHFDLPSSMQRVYASGGQEDQEVRALARKLSTAIATLGERPVIRYSKAHRSARALAQALDEEISSLPISNEKRATVLILDRTADLVSPALHEFTYQAMCYDLLEIKKDVYRYVYTNNAGEEHEKEVLIGETDQLWPIVRHWHIADTIKYVIENFNEFVRTNKAVEMKNKPKEVRAQQAYYQTNNVQVVELREMSEVMRTMPQYQELLNKYSLHIHLANQCMKVFKHKDLENIAAVEQDAATGRTANGDKVKSVISRAEKFLVNPQVGAEEKARLVLLCAITQMKKLKENDRRTLMQQAGIRPGDEYWRAIEAAVQLTSELGEASKKKKKDKKKKKEEPPQYELSRYQTRVRQVLESLVNGELSAEDFPFLGNVDAKAGLESEKQAVSLKKEKEASDWGEKGKSKDRPPEPGQPRPTVSRFGSAVVVFVLGGMSYSEMRAAYEVGATAQREVIIGAPRLFTPTEYIAALASCLRQ